MTVTGALARLGLVTQTDELQVTFVTTGSTQGHQSLSARRGDIDPCQALPSQRARRSDTGTSEYSRECSLSYSDVRILPNIGVGLFGRNKTNGSS